MADGEIRIKTLADNTELAKGLKDASQKVKMLTAEFSNQVKFLRQLEDEAKKLRQEYDLIAKGIKTPDSLISMEKELKRNQTELEKVREKTNSVSAELALAESLLRRMNTVAGVDPAKLEAARSKAALLNDEFDSLVSKGEQLSEEGARLGGLIAQIKLNPEASDEARELAARIESLSEAMGKTKKEAAGTRTELNKLSRKGAEGFNRIGSAAKAAVKGFSGFIPLLPRTVSGTGSLVRNMSLLNRHIKNASAGIQGLGNRLMKLIKTVFIFNVISAALRVARENMDALLKTNERISQSFNNIKVNLLTAFAPIWERIQPSIEVFAGVLERVTATLASFVSMLAGKTYEQSKAAAEAIYNQVKATKELGNASKSAGKGLQSFDQINQAMTDTAEDAADVTGGA